MLDRFIPYFCQYVKYIGEKDRIPILFCQFAKNEERMTGIRGFPVCFANSIWFLTGCDGFLSFLTKLRVK